MITPIETAWEPELWRIELSQALRSANDLLSYVQLSNADFPDSSTLSAVEADFPVLVPRSFADRMTPGKPADPLLRQVLARGEESRTVDGLSLGPLNETSDAAIPAPGLIKKYHGRALLITTSGCAVHCRYCFRRHFPYEEHRPTALAGALDAIRQDPTLSEVILSGGDPLLLDDRRLTELLHNLAAIPHIRRIRIHTRIPVVLPTRITSMILQTLANSAVPIIMVIHTNHPQELDHNTARALRLLSRAVRFLFNQAVLLNGINDSADVQIALCERLFDQQVLPYYLHMPDAVVGTHHFLLEDSAASVIYAKMQAGLPGFLVPKLVREIAGEASKSTLALA